MMVKKEGLEEYEEEKKAQQNKVRRNEGIEEH